MHDVIWSEDALYDLTLLPFAISSNIKTKIETYLSHNPRDLGKRLSGKFAGLYRYRYGDYRIVYQIIEKEKMIIIDTVDHRREVYKK